MNAQSRRLIKAGSKAINKENRFAKGHSKVDLVVLTLRFFAVETLNKSEKLLVCCISHLVGKINHFTCFLLSLRRIL